VIARRAAKPLLVNTDISCLREIGAPGRLRAIRQLEPLPRVP
jgi:hypothetical protein